MLLNLKHRTPIKERAIESVNAATLMAMTVRLQIFAREVIEPAAERLLGELGDRLDEVSAHRHSVDFEVAKALAYWKSHETDELIARSRKTLAVDPEIRRIRQCDDVEAIVFDRQVATLAREAIARRFGSIAERARALRDNRLNVQ